VIADPARLLRALFDRTVEVADALARRSSAAALAILIEPPA
jgi:hypothetical protein